MIELRDRLFDALNDKEKRDNLDSLCDKVIKNHSFERKFTKEERIEHQAEVSDLTVQIEDAEDQIKDLTKPLREEIKHLKKLRKRTMGEIKLGANLVQEDVYLFQEEKTLTAHVYDQFGNRISVRPLTPEEKQKVMKMVPIEAKDGTND